MMLLFSYAPQATAQNRSEYSPGSTLIEGGTLPDPGFSYVNQVWYSAATQLKGPHGNTLPVTLSASLISDSNSFSYVPQFQFLKANLDFAISISVANGNYSAIDPNDASRTIKVSGAGISDTNVVPFELGWEFKGMDLLTGYNFDFPTGHFDPNSSDNISNGYWTNSWQAGATIYLTKNKATQISIYNEYCWNTTQRATHFHPGQNDSIDYSVSQVFSVSKSGRWTLLVGAAGYAQWQTTSSGGETAIEDALKYRVYGSGVTVYLSTPYKGWFLASSAIWEYGARNTFEGRTMTFTTGIQF